MDALIQWLDRIGISSWVLLLLVAVSAWMISITLEIPQQWMDKTGLPTWVFWHIFVVFFAGVIVMALVKDIQRYRISLEIRSEASRIYLDYQEKRVHQFCVFDVKYPNERRAIPPLWRQDLHIRMYQSARSIQVERVGYIRPFRDSLRDDDLIEFSELGDLCLRPSESDDTKVQQIEIVQEVPSEALRKALWRSEFKDYYLPLTGRRIFSHSSYRRKDVKAIAMEISCPLEEWAADERELIRTESDLPAIGVLRAVIRKHNDVEAVYNFELRIHLPESIKSFNVEQIHYQPLEVEMPHTPADVIITSARSLDVFDRDTPSENHELRWSQFNVHENVIEIRLHYHET